MTYTLTKEQLLTLVCITYLNSDSIHEKAAMPEDILNSFLANIPNPTWLTGPIPKPTELCTLVLETATLPEAHTSYQYELNGYKYCGWNGIGGLKLERYIFDDPRNMKFTGRWYIQPITVPTE
jgi:hypothetical protein